jgi:hypothetical protein
MAQSPWQIVDPSFDHHYENEPVSTEQRGGEMFFTPSFCTKIALNVKTRVPCDSWLDKKCDGDQDGH